jgi:hypothetical protein
MEHTCFGVMDDVDHFVRCLKLITLSSFEIIQNCLNVGSNDDVQYSLKYKNPNNLLTGDEIWILPL